MRHLDEGTIHTWLDGQLPRDEAAVVEGHVAECRQCADAVAEARGFIAASSRILTALDGVPRDVAPKQPLGASRQPVGASRQSSAISHQPSAGGAPASADAPVIAQPATHSAAKRAQRRWFRGPSLAAAATIVVAVGTFALMRAGGDKSTSLEVAADAGAERASGPLASDSSSPVLSAPSATPAPANAPVANEARDAVATDRRGFADGARPAESRRLSEPAVAGSQREQLAKQELPTTVAATGRAATSQRERDEPQTRERPVAPAPPPAVVSAPAPARPDTTRVQVFRGSKSELAVARTDAVRQSAAKVAEDVAAATGSIRGRVTDANRTGIEGAMVTVENTAIGVASSRTGEFELNGVPAGAQQIVARRAGYAAVSQPVTVTARQVVSADIRLAPASNALAETATPRGTAAPGAAMARAPSAPVAAHGCYELGITPGSPQARADFRQVPRRIALDSAVVPARSDGIWYQVRDLTRSGVVNGVWRPTPPDGIEVQWTYGTKTATLRLTGVSGPVLRGSVEEIDRVSATGDAAAVVAGKTRCDPR